MAKTLFSKAVGYCGTIRQNRRKMTELLPDKQLSRGQADWAMDPTGLSCTKWIDNKAVLVVSNMHKPTLTTKISRCNKDGSTVNVDAPVGVADYRHHMGYADKADMLKSVKEVDPKSKKWWHRMFFSLGCFCCKCTYNI